MKDRDSSGTPVNSGSSSAEPCSAAPWKSAPSLPKPTIDQLPAPVQKWNTAKLPLRVGADVLAAAGAAFMAAPFIATIDRGIIENASGKASLRASMLKSLRTLLLRPHAFVFSRPFALIFTVYLTTYVTANTVDTVSSTVKATPFSSTTHGTAKFVGTSAANVSVSVWKDSHFTRLFSNAAPRPIPLPTYALFLLRDSLTVFASFNVPALLAPHIPDHLLPRFMKNVEKQSIAQFITPAAIQIFSTPMHLLGLNMYNDRRIPFPERVAIVRRAWMMSTLARMARIIPAFSVGGVLNTRFRRSLMQRLE